MAIPTAISVFCGSATGHSPHYAEAAARLGTLLGERGIRLVYGAGNVGLMGVVADAALAAGGEVLGVIPQFLVDYEVCHDGLTELVVTRTMHERKRIMADHSEAVIVLPGGFGTLDEYFEMLTWRQLQLHHQPLGILNTHGYYDHLLAHAERMVAEGFVRPAHGALTHVSDRPEQLLDSLMQPVSSEGLKWT